MTEIEDIYPLTPLQQGLLFHALYAPAANLYCVALSLRIRGLDGEAFRQAWQHVLERHGALRTSFHWEGLEQPLQIVHSRVDLPWAAYDWRGLAVGEQAARWQALVAADRRRPFDLQQAPLLRLALARTGESDYRLLWSHHHLLLDGWSSSLVVRDLLAAYAAFRRGDPPRLKAPRPYRDYLAWLQGRNGAEAEAFWRGTLRAWTAPTPLPLAPAPQDGGVAEDYCREQVLELDGGLTSGLQALARQHQVPLNAVVQGAFALLLSRYSGESDVLFGVTTSGRPAELAGVEDMVGLFINTVPLRLEVLLEAGLEAWLKQVHGRQMEAQQHEHAPLAQIQAWSEAGGGVPLFDALYVFENYPVGQAIGDETQALSIDEVRSFDWSNYPITLVTVPGPKLRFLLLHDARRFGEAAAKRMLGHLEQVLEGMLEEGQVAGLSLLTEAERRRAVGEWNRTAADYPRDAGIASLFDAVAEQYPDRTAIRWGEHHLSYRELQYRSNRIARGLTARGVASGARVALHLPRSADLVAMLLGILKAGAAYVPLDISYPAERLALMLKDSGACLLLTDTGPAAGLAGSGVPAVQSRDLETLAAEEPDGGPACPAGGEDLAYVVYTSGSTGTPKGVAVPQRAVVRLVRNTDFAQLGPDDRVAQASNVSFDAATFEIWGALLNGGTLVGVERDVLLSPNRLADFLRAEGVTALFLTTALFNQMARERPAAFDSLTHLLFGGEAVDPRAVADVLAQGGPRRLLHVYGPTENTTFSTWHLLKEVPAGAATLPIGRPIANSTLYILDPRGEPVPVGVPGEVYVGGDGVALGYLNQPELTAARFVPDPFGAQAGARLYRTGDTARYLEDGSVEFMGRRDTQVKIRGFRVELGEIESALLGHRSVREAAVQFAAGRLTAYLGAAPAPDVRALRRHLAKTLPDYMIPQDFVMLERLPLNANGKLDRKCLPEPERPSSIEGQRAKTPAEEIIAGIWAKVLDRAEVGLGEDFFDLGGHSLLATQVISRLREAFGTELPLSVLFQSPTVAGLARALDASRQETDGTPEIPRASRNGPLALSFAQERLWFLDQLEPGNPFYNVPIALRLRGTLDIGALEHAVAGLTARHEVLRTRFPAVDGKPAQVVAKTLKLAVPVTDLTGLQGEAQAGEARRLMAEEAGEPFDLARGPLLRPRLLRLQGEEHILLFTMHHIVADGWSLGVLVNELVPLYAESLAGGTAASPLPELTIQYADFAAWQRGWLSGPVLERQMGYWKERLAGAPPALQLPTDRPRPPVQSYRGSSVHFRIGTTLAQALHRLSRDHSATLFMSLLSAFSALLYRLSGQDDLVIGSPIANRNRVQIEPLIGFFVNTLALRVDLRDNPAFTDLLARVRATALEAYAHQDLPFERLVDEIQPERDLSLNPLFQVMFALQNAPLQRLELAGLKAELLENPRASALFDLVLDMWESGEELAGVLEYNTDLFDEATIRRLVGHFTTLLESVAANPETPLDELALLSSGEREALLAMGDGPRRSYPVEQTVHALFEHSARQVPERTAATHRGASLTYAELEACANRIARRLRHQGAGPGDFVGLLDERGLDFLCAMLGILKSGAAFLPLDPAYPAERLQYMLEDSRVKVLVTRSACLVQLAAEACRGELLLLDEDSWRAESAAALEPMAGARDLAYLLYTSGSTGLPKGAMLRHEGVVNHLYAEFELLDFRSGTAFLQSAPASSDISVWQFLAPLLVGGRTVIADRETVCDPVALLRLIRSEEITLMELVPVVLRELLEQAGRLPEEERALPALERAMVTGEAATPALVNLWLATYPGIPLVNAYGPTEAADDIAQAVLDRPLPSERGTVPIGRPLANLSVYVLDRNLQPVPLGVAGEICVSGIGVGAGYWGQEERTRESFVANPFGAWRGPVLYRTGDRGRWLPDGTLECLERLDQQVKLRGFRIELGEIEGVLNSHPAVREAAVALREDAAGEKHLFGYVVPEAEAEQVRVLTEELRREQLDLWQDLHEDSYRTVAGDETFNTIGWDSNYTGAPLPEADMREYVDHSLERILSLGPGRVLELGCGSGLILFPLLPHCEAYTGTDLSRVTIARLQALQESRDLLQRIPNLAHARFLNRRAHDWDGTEAGAFDTVILPSVVQYFPGIDYLLQVLDGVFGRALAPGGAVFVGDVRSLPLLPVFAASLQLYKADDDEPAERVAERARLQLAREQELAIAPAFFLALRQRYPDIGQVDILPKRGCHANEMTLFRYDVLIRTGARPVAPDAVWEDWRECRPGLETLRRRLQERPSLLALQRVANTKVHKEAAAAHRLLQGTGAQRAGALKAVLAAAPDLGLDPEDLWRLGAETGYRVDLSLAAGYEDGSFDAVLRPDSEDLPPAPLPTGIESSRSHHAWNRYANNPLQEKLARQLAPMLRETLKDKLPHYMVPAHYTLLAGLPLNPAGKVDRAALPTPPLASKPANTVVAPRDAQEQALAQIWSEVLGLAQVGIHDNFFELGGHSLKATQVTSRIHKGLGVQLALREIFNHPTIAELAAVVRGARREAFVAIPKTREAAHYPLSHAQRRLWVLAQMPGASAAYNMPMALLLEGRLDAEALQGALKWLATRHESLRTAFIIVGDQPRQWIAPRIAVQLTRRDLSGEGSPENAARRLAMEDAETPFDLARPGPWRASLLKLAEDRHVLLFNMHHIISDGWSMGVLEREIAGSYAALAAGSLPDWPPLAIQYRDYACWQQDYLQGEAAARSRDYWHGKLAGELPVLNLATDRRRPPVKTYRGGNLGFGIGSRQTEALAALGRAHHASVFMCLVALVKALLYRHTGQSDILIGTPIAGREHGDLESQVGFYVNTLPLRDEVDGGAPFTALLEQVRLTATEAYEHQAYPFDQLVDELRVARDVSRSPLFDVVAVMQTTHSQAPALEGIRITPFVTEYTASKFDLSFTFEQRGEDLQVDLSYNSDLFLRERIECFAAHFAELLRAVLADASTPLDRLSMLTAAERARALRPPRAAYPPEYTLVGLFEAQAAKAADRIALVFPETSAEISPQEAGPRQTLSYGELNARANRLAHHLRRLGAGTDKQVGLCLPRGLDLVVGLLGILKAGAAYVPLDPAHPGARRAFMAHDAGLALLVTDSRLGLDWPGLAVPMVDLTKDAWAIAADSPDNPAPLAEPGHLAYVIYTSGSTGHPKGVAVTHHNVVRLFQTTEALFGFHSDDVWTLFHSTAFDFSVWELWGALLHGGRLVVVPYWVSRSPPEFHRLLGREEVSVLNQTPSAFRQLMRADEDTPARLRLRLRYVIFGGEALQPSLLKTWFERHGDQVPRLVNMYGITETTVHVTYRPLSGADLEAPGSLIGRPLADLKLHILGPQLEPVPVGVCGELYVGGGGVARGYLNRPELNAQRFIADPYGGDPDARLYRTGDLARLLPDGDMEYLGRTDHQVQVRGFRVELGEIEAALRRCEGIREAAVISDGEAGALRLLAYLVAARGLDIPALRRHLAGLLPDYMLPSAFIPLDALPLTANGKLDRAALPRPDLRRVDTGAAYVPAERETEKAIAAVFAQVLERERVGLHDNFFDLGANSLLLMQAHRKLQQSLTRDIPVVRLFQFPTVAALARSLDGEETDTLDEVRDRAARQREAQRRRKARKP